MKYVAKPTIYKIGGRSIYTELDIDSHTPNVTQIYECAKSTNRRLHSNCRDLGALCVGQRTGMKELTAMVIGEAMKELTIMV